ncbi:hypothetical protein OPV22_032898 [Ensete ventricosum]|uniref:Secreted protein n=1 Tax=Ensete ventricosum TaxID=4639 RepID=A0AAV8PXV9_ENSVE|nr:hypothetical protein OPV22_032898 [Ensete ventricosum]
MHRLRGRDSSVCLAAKPSFIHPLIPLTSIIAAAAAAAAAADAIRRKKKTDGFRGVAEEPRQALLPLSLSQKGRPTGTRPCLCQSRALLFLLAFASQHQHARPVPLPFTGDQLPSLGCPFTQDHSDFDQSHIGISHNVGCPYTRKCD